MRGWRVIPVLLLFFSVILLPAKNGKAAIVSARSEQNVSAVGINRAVLPPHERAWWGVLYENALLLAQTDGQTNAEQETAPQDEQQEIEFVWPLWNWLLRLLGLSSAD